LHVEANERDSCELGVDYYESNTQLFQLLRKPGVIDVIMCCQLVWDALKLYAHAAACVAHGGKSSGPSGVYEQPRLGVCQQVIVGRAVPDVDNVHGSNGHG